MFPTWRILRVTLQFSSKPSFALSWALLVAAFLSAQPSLASSSREATTREKGATPVDQSGLPEASHSALESYAKAAAAGSAAAQNNLGVAYLVGWGVPSDVSAGLRWLGKAADQGNADARYNLRAACHTTPNPPSICSNHRISTAAYFQRPCAKVLWRTDFIQ